MKRRVVHAALVMVMLVASLLVACAPKEETIKIGLITDLSAYLSVNGIPIKQGAILAMEQANYEVAGRPVTLIIEDEACDPALAVDRARKLVETDKVCMILGPFHGGSILAVSSFLEPYGVPHISTWTCLSNEAQAKAGPSWSPWGTMEQVGTALVAYAFEELGYRTATTVGSDYEAGHAFINGFVADFEARGGKVIQQQWIPMGTIDVASYIIALQEADVLVSWTAGATTTAFLRQVKEFGVEMPIVIPSTSAAAHPKQIVDIGDAFVGVITGESYVGSLPGPKNKAYVDAFQAKWGEMPAGCSYGGYATVQIALDALRRTKGDISPEALHKALAKTNLEGITGTFRFTDARVGIYTHFVHKVIKVEDQYRTEVLAFYTIETQKVGDELVHRIIDKEIFR